ncbi:MAG TPA: hypothetical protein PLG17_08570 [Thermodesulfobacteriota bacterium]|nr:hypothetical protein [Deltaproteobacteria bacterium]HNR12656.1 hypothetical protein [Thermodesulfobacteriota bacterium]HNU70317.1 hypothetical protein [Thermodesulfobacteriota bacterium]HQO78551.1 hypothetical protein [Thermodesulfobacteriota bacterium]
MATIVFVLSTGRTGTKKLADYIVKHCDAQIAVDHQVGISQVMNMLANMRYAGFLPVQPLISHAVRRLIKSRSTGDCYINCDPLLSFCLPWVDFSGFDVRFLHIVRTDEDFARSMINWQFSRPKSFVAHNLVAFWQPGLWPLQHLMHGFDKQYLLQTYKSIWRVKNDLFESTFKEHARYLKVEFKDLYGTEEPVFLQVVDFMGIAVDFIPDEFYQKVNASSARFIA